MEFAGHLASVDERAHLEQRGSGICASCGRIRRLGELIAFWPIGEPGRRSFVCRPSDPLPPFMTCFRDTVGTIDEHQVGPAVLA